MPGGWRPTADSRAQLEEAALHDAGSTQSATAWGALVGPRPGAERRGGQLHATEKGRVRRKARGRHTRDYVLLQCYCSTVVLCKCSRTALGTSYRRRVCVPPSNRSCQTQEAGGAKGSWQP